MQEIAEIITEDIGFFDIINPIRLLMKNRLFKKL